MKKPCRNTSNAEAVKSVDSFSFVREFFILYIRQFYKPEMQLQLPVDRLTKAIGGLQPRSEI